MNLVRLFCQLLSMNVIMCIVFFMFMALQIHRPFPNNAKGTWRLSLSMCESVSRRQTPPVKAWLLFHLQHLLFFLERLGPASAVRLVRLFRCNHFSHICRLVMAASKPIPPRAYSITEGSCELFVFLSVCSLPEALYRHFETIRYISEDL